MKNKALMLVVLVLLLTIPLVAALPWWLEWFINPFTKSQSITGQQVQTITESQCIQPGQNPACMTPQNTGACTVQGSRGTCSNCYCVPLGVTPPGGGTVTPGCDPSYSTPECGLGAFTKVQVGTTCSIKDIYGNWLQGTCKVKDNYGGFTTAISGICGCSIPPQNPCGNGQLDFGEQCDPAKPLPWGDIIGCTSLNAPNGQKFTGGTLTCNPKDSINQCTFNTQNCYYCGDGTCNSNENINTCPTDCRRCGDGVVNPPELCDKGEINGAQALIANCGSVFPGQPPYYCTDNCLCNQQTNTCTDSSGSAILNFGGTNQYFFNKEQQPTIPSNFQYYQRTYQNPDGTYANTCFKCKTTSNLQIGSQTIPTYAVETYPCSVAQCGDGKIDAGETCDKGGLNGASSLSGSCNNNQYCSTDCKSCSDKTTCTTGTSENQGAIGATITKGSTTYEFKQKQSPATTDQTYFSNNYNPGNYLDVCYRCKSMDVTTVGAQVISGFKVESYQCGITQPAKCGDQLFNQNFEVCERGSATTPMIFRPPLIRCPSENQICGYQKYGTWEHPDACKCIDVPVESCSAEIAKRNPKLFFGPLNNQQINPTKIQNELLHFYYDPGYTIQNIRINVDGTDTSYVSPVLAVARYDAYVNFKPTNGQSTITIYNGNDLCYTQTVQVPRCGDGTFNQASEKCEFTDGDLTKPILGSCPSISGKRAVSCNPPNTAGADVQNECTCNYEIVTTGCGNGMLEPNLGEECDLNLLNAHGSFSDPCRSQNKVCGSLLGKTESDACKCFSETKCGDTQIQNSEKCEFNPLTKEVLTDNCDQGTVCGVYQGKTGDAACACQPSTCGDNYFDQGQADSNHEIIPGTGEACDKEDGVVSDDLCYETGRKCGWNLNKQDDDRCKCFSVERTYCGDGTIQSLNDEGIKEICDPGSDEGKITCAPDQYCANNCACAPKCPNGKLDPGEGCDLPLLTSYVPGRPNPLNTCSGNTPMCGWDILGKMNGERCQCWPAQAKCGDGTVNQDWEECDGDTNIDDLCRTKYPTTPTNSKFLCAFSLTKQKDCQCLEVKENCGNNKLDEGEQCDTKDGTTQFDENLCKGGAASNDCASCNCVPKPFCNKTGTTTTIFTGSSQFSYADRNEPPTGALPSRYVGSKTELNYAEICYDCEVGNVGVYSYDCPIEKSQCGDGDPNKPLLLLDPGEECDPGETDPNKVVNIDPRLGNSGNNYCKNCLRYVCYSTEISGKTGIIYQNYGGKSIFLPDQYNPRIFSTTGELQELSLDKLKTELPSSNLDDFALDQGTSNNKKSITDACWTCGPPSETPQLQLLINPAWTLNPALPTESLIHLVPQPVDCGKKSKCGNSKIDEPPAVDKKEECDWSPNSLTGEINKNDEVCRNCEKSYCKESNNKVLYKAFGEEEKAYMNGRAPPASNAPSTARGSSSERVDYTSSCWKCKTPEINEVSIGLSTGIIGGSVAKVPVLETDPTKCGIIIERAELKCCAKSENGKIIPLFDPFTNALISPRKTKEACNTQIGETVQPLNTCTVSCGTCPDPTIKKISGNANDQPHQEFIKKSPEELEGLSITHPPKEGCPRKPNPKTPQYSEICQTNNVNIPGLSVISPVDEMDLKCIKSGKGSKWDYESCKCIPGEPAPSEQGKPQSVACQIYEASGDVESEEIDLTPIVNSAPSTITPAQSLTLPGITLGSDGRLLSAQANNNLFTGSFILPITKTSITGFATLAQRTPNPETNTDGTQTYFYDDGSERVITTVYSRNELGEIIGESFIKEIISPTGERTIREKLSDGQIRETSEGIKITYKLLPGDKTQITSYEDTNQNYIEYYDYLPDGTRKVTNNIGGGYKIQQAREENGVPQWRTINELDKFNRKFNYAYKTQDVLGKQRRITIELDEDNEILNAYFYNDDKKPLSIDCKKNNNDYTCTYNIPEESQYEREELPDGKIKYTKKENFPPPYWEICEPRYVKDSKNPFAQAKPKCIKTQSQGDYNEQTNTYNTHYYTYLGDDVYERRSDPNSDKDLFVYNSETGQTIMATTDDGTKYYPELQSDGTLKMRFEDGREQLLGNKIKVCPQDKPNCTEEEKIETRPLQKMWSPNGDITDITYENGEKTYKTTSIDGTISYYREDGDKYFTFKIITKDGEEVTRTKIDKGFTEERYVTKNGLRIKRTTTYETAGDKVLPVKYEDSDGSSATFEAGEQNELKQKCGNDICIYEKHGESFRPSEIIHSDGSKDLYIYETYKGYETTKLLKSDGTYYLSLSVEDVKDDDGNTVYDEFGEAKKRSEIIVSYTGDEFVCNAKLNDNTYVQGVKDLTENKGALSQYVYVKPEVKQQLLDLKIIKPEEKIQNFNELKETIKRGTVDETKKVEESKTTSFTIRFANKKGEVYKQTPLINGYLKLEPDNEFNFLDKTKYAHEVYYQALMEYCYLPPQTEPTKEELMAQALLEYRRQQEEESTRAEREQQALLASQNPKPVSCTAGVLKDLSQIKSLTPPEPQLKYQITDPKHDGRIVRSVNLIDGEEVIDDYVYEDNKDELEKTPYTRINVKEKTWVKFDKEGKAVQQLIKQENKLRQTNTISLTGAQIIDTILNRDAFYQTVFYTDDSSSLANCKNLETINYKNPLSDNLDMSAWSECLKNEKLCNPGECPAEEDKVCGKDGKTYKNSCIAKQNNAEIDYSGECTQTTECVLNTPCGTQQTCPNGKTYNTKICKSQDPKVDKTTGKSTPRPNVCAPNPEITTICISAQCPARSISNKCPDGTLAKNIYDQNNCLERVDCQNPTNGELRTPLGTCPALSDIPTPPTGYKAIPNFDNNGCAISSDLVPLTQQAQEQPIQQLPSEEKQPSTEQPAETKLINCDQVSVCEDGTISHPLIEQAGQCIPNPAGQCEQKIITYNTETVVYRDEDKDGRVDIDGDNIEDSVLIQKLGERAEVVRIPFGSRDNDYDNDGIPNWLDIDKYNTGVMFTKPTYSIEEVPEDRDEDNNKDVTEMLLAGPLYAEGQGYNFENDKLNNLITDKERKSLSSIGAVITTFTELTPGYILLKLPYTLTNNLQWSAPSITGRLVAPPAPPGTPQATPSPEVKIEVNKKDKVLEKYDYLTNAYDNTNVLFENHDKLKDHIKTHYNKLLTLTSEVGDVILECPDKKDVRTEIDQITTKLSDEGAETLELSQAEVDVTRDFLKDTLDIAWSALNGVDYWKNFVDKINNAKQNKDQAQKDAVDAKTRKDNADKTLKDSLENAQTKLKDNLKNKLKISDSDLNDPAKLRNALNDLKSKGASQENIDLLQGLINTQNFLDNFHELTTGTERQQVIDNAQARFRTAQSNFDTFDLKFKTPSGLSALLRANGGGLIIQPGDSPEDVARKQAANDLALQTIIQNRQTLLDNLNSARTAYNNQQNANRAWSQLSVDNLQAQAALLPKNIRDQINPVLTDYASTVDNYWRAQNQAFQTSALYDRWFGDIDYPTNPQFILNSDDGRAMASNELFAGFLNSDISLSESNLDMLVSRAEQVAKVANRKRREDLIRQGKNPDERDNEGNLIYKPVEPKITRDELINALTRFKDANTKGELPDQADELLIRSMISDLVDGKAKDLINQYGKLRMEEKQKLEDERKKQLQKEIENAKKKAERIKNWDWQAETQGLIDRINNLKPIVDSMIKPKFEEYKNLAEKLKKQVKDMGGDETATQRIQTELNNKITKIEEEIENMNNYISDKVLGDKAPSTMTPEELVLKYPLKTFEHVKAKIKEYEAELAKVKAKSKRAVELQWSLKQENKQLQEVYFRLAHNYVIAETFYHKAFIDLIDLPDLILHILLVKSFSCTVDLPILGTTTPDINALLLEGLGRSSPFASAQGSTTPTAALALTFPELQTTKLFNKLTSKPKFTGALALTLTGRAEQDTTLTKEQQQLIKSGVCNPCTTNNQIVYDTVSVFETFKNLKAKGQGIAMPASGTITKEIPVPPEATEKVTAPPNDSEKIDEEDGTLESAGSTAVQQAPVPEVILGAEVSFERPEEEKPKEIEQAPKLEQIKGPCEGAENTKIIRTIDGLIPAQNAQNVDLPSITSDKLSNDFKEENDCFNDYKKLYTGDAFREFRRNNMNALNDALREKGLPVQVQNWQAQKPVYTASDGAEITVENGNLMRTTSAGLKAQIGVTEQELLTRVEEFANQQFYEPARKKQQECTTISSTNAANLMTEANNAGYSNLDTVLGEDGRTIVTFTTSDGQKGQFTSDGVPLVFGDKNQLGQLIKDLANFRSAGASQSLIDSTIADIQRIQNQQFVNIRGVSTPLNEKFARTDLGQIVRFDENDQPYVFDRGQKIPYTGTYTNPQVYSLDNGRITSYDVDENFGSRREHDLRTQIAPINARINELQSSKLAPSEAIELQSLTQNRDQVQNDLTNTNSKIQDANSKIKQMTSEIDALEKLDANVPGGLNVNDKRRLSNLKGTLSNLKIELGYLTENKDRLTDNLKKTTERISELESKAQLTPEEKAELERLKKEQKPLADELKKFDCLRIVFNEELAQQDYNNLFEDVDAKIAATQAAITNAIAMGDLAKVDQLTDDLSKLLDKKAQIARDNPEKARSAIMGLATAEAQRALQDGDLERALQLMNDAIEELKGLFNVDNAEDALTYGMSEDEKQKYKEFQEWKKTPEYLKWKYKLREINESYDALYKKFEKLDDFKALNDQLIISKALNVQQKAQILEQERQGADFLNKFRNLPFAYLLINQDSYKAALKKILDASLKLADDLLININNAFGENTKNAIKQIAGSAVLTAAQAQISIDYSTAFDLNPDEPDALQKIMNDLINANGNIDLLINKYSGRLTITDEKGITTDFVDNLIKLKKGISDNIETWTGYKTTLTAAQDTLKQLTNQVEGSAPLTKDQSQQLANAAKDLIDLYLKGVPLTFDQIRSISTSIQMALNTKDVNAAKITSIGIEKLTDSNVNPKLIIDIRDRNKLTELLKTTIGIYNAKLKSCKDCAEKQELQNTLNDLSNAFYLNIAHTNVLKAQQAILMDGASPAILGRAETYEKLLIESEGLTIEEKTALANKLLKDLSDSRDRSWGETSKISKEGDKWKDQASLGLDVGGSNDKARKANEALADEAELRDYYSGMEDAILSFAESNGLTAVLQQMLTKSENDLTDNIHQSTNSYMGSEAARNAQIATDFANQNLRTIQRVQESIYFLEETQRMQAENGGKSLEEWQLIVARITAKGKAKNELDNLVSTFGREAENLKMQLVDLRKISYSAGSALAFGVGKWLWSKTGLMENSGGWANSEVYHIVEGLQAKIKSLNSLKTSYADSNQASDILSSMNGIQDLQKQRSTAQYALSIAQAKGEDTTKLQQAFDGLTKGLNQANKNFITQIIQFERNKGADLRDKIRNTRNLAQGLTISDAVKDALKYGSLANFADWVTGTDRIANAELQKWDTLTNVLISIQVGEKLDDNALNVLDDFGIATKTENGIVLFNFDSALRTVSVGKGAKTRDVPRFIDGFDSTASRILDSHSGAMEYVGLELALDLLPMSWAGKAMRGVEFLREGIKVGRTGKGLYEIEKFGSMSLKAQTWFTRAHTWGKIASESKFLNAVAGLLETREGGFGARVLTFELTNSMGKAGLKTTLGQDASQDIAWMNVFAHPGETAQHLAMGAAMLGIFEGAGHIAQGLGKNAASKLALQEGTKAYSLVLGGITHTGTFGTMFATDLATKKILEGKDLDWDTLITAGSQAGLMTVGLGIMGGHTPKNLKGIESTILGESKLGRDVLAVRDIEIAQRARVEHLTRKGNIERDLAKDLFDKVEVVLVDQLPQVDRSKLNSFFEKVKTGDVDLNNAEALSRTMRDTFGRDFTSAEVSSVQERMQTRQEAESKLREAESEMRVQQRRQDYDQAMDKFQNGENTNIRELIAREQNLRVAERELLDSRKPTNGVEKNSIDLMRRQLTERIDGLKNNQKVRDMLKTNGIEQLTPETIRNLKSQNPEMLDAAREALRIQRDKIGEIKAQNTDNNGALRSEALDLLIRAEEAKVARQEAILNGGAVIGEVMSRGPIRSVNEIARDIQAREAELRNAEQSRRSLVCS